MPNNTPDQPADKCLDLEAVERMLKSALGTHSLGYEEVMTEWAYSFGQILIDYIRVAESALVAARAEVESRDNLVRAIAEWFSVNAVHPPLALTHRDADLYGEIVGK